MGALMAQKPNRSPAVRLALAVACSWLGMTTAHTSGAASEPNLVLSLQMDETRYLEDQRIEVAVCVRSESQDSFRDFAPLHPDGGYLILELRNLTTGDRVPASRFPPLAVDGEGETLGPGLSRCEAFNLLHWYGRARDGEPGLAGCLGSKSLPPARYSLEATFLARSGFVPALSPVVLRVAPIEFIVEPASANSVEADLVQRFTDSCPQVEGADRQPIARHCFTWLPSFRDSRYYMLVYYNTGTLLTSLDVDSLLANLDRQGGNGVRQASLVALRCNVERLGDAARRRWMESLRNRRSDELSRTVIDTWISRTPGGP